jgi:hypothetical protein
VRLGDHRAAVEARDHAQQLGQPRQLDADRGERRQVEVVDAVEHAPVLDALRFGDEFVERRAHRLAVELAAERDVEAVRSVRGDGEHAHLQKWLL